MAMKRLLLTLMLLGASLLIFAQDYPFSVVKSPFLSFLSPGQNKLALFPGYCYKHKHFDPHL